MQLEVGKQYRFDELPSELINFTNGDILTVNGMKVKGIVNNNGTRSFEPVGMNFDYEAEAQKAYGELGSYYDRILKESEGDLNKALARLVQDYDRGTRIKREDAQVERGAINLAQREAEYQREQNRRSTVDNALARGLYQKSAHDPQGGFGIPTQNLEQINTVFGFGEEGRQKQRKALDTNLSRFEQEYGPSGFRLSRAKEDTTTQIDRNKFQLEQERREKAASLANQRGARAQQDYAMSSQLFNPSLA